MIEELHKYQLAYEQAKADFEAAILKLEDLAHRYDFRDPAQAEAYFVAEAELQEQTGYQAIFANYLRAEQQLLEGFRRAVLHNSGFPRN